jgi:uncharacterized protein with von Willebrand factor type A (vWA) domain
MNNSDFSSLDLLLLDLFQEMRKAGMALTLEQYELLREAVTQGYGLGEWEDIKRICRLLWVKPSANYDGDIFNHAFEQYKNKYVLDLKESVSPRKLIEIAPPDTKPKPPLNLPEIPPRRYKKPTPTDKEKQPDKIEIPDAVKTKKFEKFKNVKQNFYLTPTGFPIKLHDVQVTWRCLRQAKRPSLHYELDVEATINRIEQEGIFSDVVMSPVQVRQTELLLLIDDSLAMIPFFPALGPFIQAIEQSRITPASIYRFTSYPDEYLYHWHYPVQGEPLTHLLTKLHRHRTIAIIFSDAGAATATYSQKRIEGISKFLSKLSRCTWQIIWLNPLPFERWKQTSSEKIYQVLNGKMLTYEPASLQKVVKEIPEEITIKIWQIHSQI